MLIVDPGKVIRVLLVCSALLVPNTIGLAQKKKPTRSPAQRSAKQPPGTETEPAKAPPASVATPTPPETPTPEPTPLQEPSAPNFPQVQPRPLPPMPNLTRLGIVSSNVLTLSLNEAIRLALANNNDIEVSRDDVRYAETQLRSLRGIYDPIFSVTPTYDKRITPITSIFGGASTAGTVSNTVYTISPTVSKSISRGGGSYDVTFSNSRTVTSATSSTLNPYFSSNLSFSFTQPLLRNRVIDNNRRQIQVQKKRVEQSDADFRRKTIDVISQVQSGYWDLVFAMRDQQVQLDNVNLSRENLRQIEAQISAGAKAPLDRSEVLTELANRESSLLTATQTVSIAENNLKQLMLRDTMAPQWSAQITPTDTPVVDTNPVLLDDAIAEARKNRPELQRLKLQKEINGIDLQYFRNQTKPQLDLQTTFASTGLAGTKVPCIPTPTRDCPVVPANLIGSYRQDFTNVFGFKTRNVVIGLAIQIPFKNTIALENLAGAQIQKEQLEASVRSTEQIVEVDVRNAAQSVESARLRVITSRAARANAEIQLEGEQRLYSVGRSTTYLLIQRQNALANARDQEVRAETDYTKAVANLQRATSTTLHANNVIVDNPTKP